MSHAAGVVSGRTLERLRARDQREKDRVTRAEERKVRMARRLAESSAPDAGTIETFLSLIDDSGGPHTCHEWKGRRQWNHRDPNVERFEQGTLHVPGISTYYAHRIICIHTFGLGCIDPEIDISPTCGNHLCCNIDHLVARPHGGNEGAAHVEAIPVTDFFRAETTKDAGREDLERAADRLLAA